jgi:hypothetical protein
MNSAISGVQRLKSEIEPVSYVDFTAYNHAIILIC